MCNLAYVKKSSTFDLLPHTWGPLRKYCRVLPDIRKGGCFSSSLKAFVLNVPIGRFYASINAPYAHLIHKISFYLAKNTRKFAYVQFLLYLCGII